MSGEAGATFAWQLVFVIWLGFIQPVHGENQPAADHDVIVIGAGASGLSAGYFLQQQGIDIAIVEAQESTGGVVRSGVKGDFHYSKSTQPYLTGTHSALKKIVDGFSIPLVEIPLPVTALLHDGKIYTGCTAINELTTSITGENNFNSFLESMNDLVFHYREGGDFHSRAARTGLDLLSAAQWMNDLRIHPFLQARYNIMVRSQFGANLEDISAYSLASERHLLKASKKTGHDTGSLLWSPPTGIISIVNALTQQLQPVLHLGSTVTSVSFDNQVYVVKFRHNEQLHTITGRSLVVSTPAFITLQIAEPVLTAMQRRLLEQISYTSYITVALYSDRPVFDKAFSLTLLNNGFITELYDATWIERHTTAGKAQGRPYIVSAHLAPKDFQDNNLIEMSDEQLMDVIFSELAPLHQNIPELITGHDIQRFPSVCPVMLPGAYHRLEQLGQSQQGIYLAGDYTIHPSFEAAIESGFDAAQKAAVWVKKLHLEKSSTQLSRQSTQNNSVVSLPQKHSVHDYELSSIRGNPPGLK
ncbi:flavin monoamine oxidase family protein [Endozoicomonadaceae bacterium StTr2]